MSNNLMYEERISSNWTELLFAGLTLLFLLLGVWRISMRGLNFLGAAFLVITVVFFFYAINYRTLIVRIDSQALRLKFGIFSWKIPLSNIEECGIDDLPVLMKYGGAGIHFMMIRGRYRASFNFLEHPRIVIGLKNKAGPVRDVSFSTRQPEAVIQALETRASARNTLLKISQEHANK